MVRKRGEKKAKSLREGHEEGGVLMDWSVHLAREAPLKAAFVMVSVALVVALGWIGVHPFVAFVMGAFLLHHLAEFLFPIRYRLTDTGAEAVGFLYWRGIEWERVRRIVSLPDGVLLSPFPRPTRLDAFRGVFLRWGGDREGYQKLETLCRELASKGSRSRHP